MYDDTSASPVQQSISRTLWNTFQIGDFGTAPLRMKIYRDSALRCLSSVKGNEDQSKSDLQITLPDWNQIKERITVTLLQHRQTKIQIWRPNGREVKETKFNQNILLLANLWNLRHECTTQKIRIVPHPRNICRISVSCVTPPVCPRCIIDNTNMHFRIKIPLRRTPS